ncbi:tRNA uracil 4-sulfurtransferase ThiI [Peribacillus tepidiphilus]|uniref:tRNA uracil 4-sulfurtransferase ThiI n=1 Tax=Peribacillus tepidiphilus TaxID=2652445 RepID=UPI001780B90F|nr:tRNA uracil 4-sulfurtransferase ThiI [Peribacillus tepidiphilus]
MKYDHIIIRYGEMSTKGRNRKLFIDRLKKSIKKSLADFKAVSIDSKRDRMYVLLNGEDHEPIIDRLKRIFGIQSLSPAIKVERDIEEIKHASLHYVKHLSKNIQTFKVDTNRADKSFPMKTDEINHSIGGHILKNTDGLKVDVRNPDLKLIVDVRKDAVYLTGEIIPGAGGLPYGSSGKAMLMLSGGIDSPVAGYLSLKRGLEIECIHFYSPPFTSERSKQKVLDLANVLAGFTGKMTVHIVPFTEIQKLIHKQIPESYTMTSTRRLMLQIADRLREKNEGLAIVTGESLGQVASQTLNSMYTINEVTNTPVLRPLITMDKTEIIEMARTIGTLDISNRPYEDCCTVFTPANPKTKPKLEKVQYYESFIDFSELIKEAVENTETIHISSKNDNHSLSFFDLL